MKDAYAMVHRILDASDGFSGSFLGYCALHGAEHDESFIPGPGWGYGDDHPSFVLVDGDGRVRGAAAAIFKRSFRNARRARFAILHVAGPASDDDYGRLSSAVAGAVGNGADELYLFHPEANAPLRSILDRLGFRFERTAWLMRADAALTPAASLPAGYRLQALARDDAAGLAEFVAVRNRNFREVRGSTDSTTADLRDFIASDDYLDGGLMLLRAPDGQACGTLRVERDDEEGSTFIGTVSVDRNHRGKGLGRAIIRSALAFSKADGFRQAFLSVNADNRAALSLYAAEGFEVVKAMTCMAAAPSALLRG